MKKIYLIIFLILAYSSCDTELNQVPISSASASNFFRNATDFKQAVNGVYNALGANPQTGSGYAIRRFELSEIRSDNVYSSGTGVRDWNPINNFEKTLSTNPYMTEAWNSNYIGILRANTVLDKLNATLVPDNVVRAQLEGEAKFLRAFFYFDLVRWFGKVPIIDHTLTPSEALSVKRGEVADVYALIISDLTTAVALLPATYAAADRGRATNLSAKAMLGLVYLTRTGATYGIAGPGLATNEYTQAVTNFNDVIASGRFSFVGSYASIFSYTNENNPDIVFDIQAINSGSSGDLGTGARFVTEMYDGLYGNKPTTTCNPICGAIGFAGGADLDSPKSPSKDLKNSFEGGDVRLPFSVLNSYVQANGSTVSTGMYVKFLDATRKGVDRFNWPINYPVIRYTDVLMMKAEAILRGGFGPNGTQADVDAIVNQVRTRAGLGSIAGVTLAQLLNERRHEFMAEGLRWHDLVRNGIVLTTMNTWATTGPDDIARKIKAITANDIIYPVPQTQLLLAPGLYDQNPGY